MRPAWMFAMCIAAGVAAALPGTARSASPPASIVLTGPAGAAAALTPARLAALPAMSETVSFGTDHGVLKASYAGPLLWAVLQAGAAVDVKTPKAIVHEYALITGADGYQAVVALGEIAPAFENKGVILALQMNGKPLEPGHYRIIVPGDARGGRSVRDVVSIAVVLAGANLNQGH